LRENYSVEIWKDFDERFVLQLLEVSFRKQGYNVENLHEIDRPHEAGIDLLCEKEQERIALQAKIKPRKRDIDQFDCFVDNTAEKRAIYVYIQSPTRSFLTHVEELHTNVEFWDVTQLHEFLVTNEIAEYLCLYFSKHPLVLALADVHNLISGNRRASCPEHELSAGELATLWSAKDNSVKARILLYFIYQKWNRTLMSKTTVNKDEFEQILQSIFGDLDLAYEICGQRLVSSFDDLSQRYPNILGLFWELASHRTGWSTYTTRVERSDSAERTAFFTLYNWICPVFDDFCLIAQGMRGFYSTMNYLLENLNDIAKNLEDALDWTFGEMNRR
jgi:hypothetical protein